MVYTVRVNWIGAVAALAAGVGLSVVLSTLLATRAYEKRVDQIERADQAVTVKGYARTGLTADTAVWSIGLTGRGGTQEEAYETLRFNVARTRAFLDARGFEASEVAMRPIEAEEHPARDARGRETLAVAGYTLRRTATVRTGDVERVRQAASLVTELLGEGITLSSHAPEYTSSRLGEVKVDIIGGATADARRRAEEIAARAGARVAEVRNARQGVMQVTKPDSTSVSSYGIYDTSTIQKQASIVMTITFGLEDERE